MAIANPYQTWLDLETDGRPADHYQLLALNRFESDRSAIVDAARRQSALVRSRSSKGDAALAKKVLREIRAAHDCLIDPARKAEYDLKLKQQIGVRPVPLPGAQHEPVSLEDARSPQGRFMDLRSLVTPRSAAIVVLLLIIGVAGAFLLLRDPGGSDYQTAASQASTNGGLVDDGAGNSSQRTARQQGSSNNATATETDISGDAVAANAEGAGAEAVFLADLEPVSTEHQHPFGKNVLAISVHGEKSPHGIWAHPPKGGGTSATVYEIDGKYRRLFGAVAINDVVTTRTGRPLSFRILGEGKELWASRPLQEARSRQEFDVDVTGVDQLRLECSSSSWYNAHGVWFEPRLSKESPIRVATTDDRPAGTAADTVAIGPSPDATSAEQGRLICERLEGKRQPQGLISGAKHFAAPRGEGRIGANGFYLPETGLPPRWGSSWSFSYQRAGHARGVDVIHPFRDGHVVVQLRAEGVSVYSGGDWQGYGAPRSESFEKTSDFAATFPIHERPPVPVESAL
ncbi:MAG: NPCBM/NEW2 domain-containing protein, partial [Planctomycetes bacterium]|nr:NPCBM/NEW2 domain-containing protein [Planctomycetota bacterium]